LHVLAHLHDAALRLELNEELPFLTTEIMGAAVSNELVRLRLKLCPTAGQAVVVTSRLSVGSTEDAVSLTCHGLKPVMKMYLQIIWRYSGKIVNFCDRNFQKAAS
jgi:hypothetical protein